MSEEPQWKMCLLVEAKEQQRPVRGCGGASLQSCVTHSPRVPPCGTRRVGGGGGELYDAGGRSVSELRGETDSLTPTGSSRTRLKYTRHQ